ncbi:ATP-grasp domain-containing protein [Streptomyces sp. NPDC048182]|uniref:ATP-grasp domain-containing protein n=1 Tax=Streptomyces sp. NPDC048182 TaxID=3365507 RepID=UPI00371E68D3
MTGTPHPAPPPVLALVESNTTGSGREFAAAARHLGLRPVVLTARPERYPYLATDGVDHLPVDTEDPAAVRKAADELVGAPGGLSGVTSSSEYYVATAAATAAALDLPAPDADAIARCRRKDLQRAALATAGLAPGFRTVTGPDAALDAARALGYPVVAKPTTGSGSVGVRLCPGPDSLHRHVTGLLAAATDERGRPVPRRALVERYVDGPEYSVETFDTTPVAVVAKHLGPAPHFVETGHDFPADVPGALTAALADAALAALAALGLGWGAAHTELRVGPDGPVVIEVNPRPAGGMIPALVRLGSGFDLVSATVARAVGRSPDLRARPRARTAIRFAVAREAGTVTALGGLDAARAVPGVAHAEFTTAPGERITLTHSFRDRVGYALATDPADLTDPAGSADPAAPTTARTAADRAAHAARLLTVTTAPERTP